MRNPFKNRDRRAEFDAVVRCYEKKDRALFAQLNGEILGRSGNSWSSAFWAGYDGMTRGVRVPGRDAISYPWYVAGVAIRERETNG